MATEDAQYLPSDTQTLMETGVRTLSSGWLSNRPGSTK
jgi:hypothetical protein